MSLPERVTSTCQWAELGLLFWTHQGEQRQYKQATKWEGPHGSVIEKHKSISRNVWDASLNLNRMHPECPEAELSCTLLLMYTKGMKLVAASEKEASTKTSVSVTGVYQHTGPYSDILETSVQAGLKDGWRCQLPEYTPLPSLKSRVCEVLFLCQRESHQFRTLTMCF